MASLSLIVSAIGMPIKASGFIENKISSYNYLIFIFIHLNIPPPFRTATISPYDSVVNIFYSSSSSIIPTTLNV